MTDAFWKAVEAQLKELESAKTAADVVRILSRERNPYGHETIAADGFFAGGGGDDSVEAALDEAGWVHVWREAEYYWCMRAPDGSHVTYVEGDIYLGNPKNQRPPAEGEEV